MAVKIRLQRGGAVHAPHYRVVIADIRAPRDGRFVEKVGTYDPKNKDRKQQVNLNLERIDYWLGVGAQPSDTVKSLIRNARRSAPSEAATEAPAAEAAKAPEPQPAPATEAPAAEPEAAATEVPEPEPEAAVPSSEPEAPEAEASGEESPRTAE